MLAKGLYTGSYFEKSASKAGALKALLAALGVGGLGALYARNGGLEADREALYGANVPVSANDMDKQQPGILDYLSNYLNIGAANAVSRTGRFFNKKHKESYDNLVPQVYGPTPEEFSANMLESASRLMNDTDAQQNSAANLGGYLNQLSRNFSSGDPSQLDAVKRLKAESQVQAPIDSAKAGLSSLMAALTGERAMAINTAYRNNVDAQQNSSSDGADNSWKERIWNFNRETPDNPIGKSTSTPRIPNVNNPEGKALMSAIATKLTEGAGSVRDTLAEAASREVKPKGSKKKDSE